MTTMELIERGIGHNCLSDAYDLGRTDAERDFQNSDYWNDYLSKVIADAKTDAINEFVTRFEEKYNRITVHLGEFRKYQFEMHRLAEEMLKE